MSLEIYFILIKKVANVDIVSKYVEPTISVMIYLNSFWRYDLHIWGFYWENQVKNIYLFLTSVEKVQPKKQRPVT